MSYNPYIAGNPTTGEQFHGRDDILRQVERFLQNPHENALVLYGQRRIGKTSILLQLEQALEANQQYTPVYFDLQDRAGKPLPEVLYELAQRIAHKVNQPPPDREQFDSAGRYFQETFLPHIAAQAGAGGLVLLFDEFDVLGDHAPGNTPDQAAGDQFFPYLRQWMTNVADVNFIFVIGRRPEDLSLNSMSTFKGTRTIQVSTMSQTDTERVIRQAEQNGSVTWPPEVVQTVWEWTNGHPYMTQLLCYVIWETVVDAHEEAERDGIPTATPQAVAEAIPQALQQGANAFQWIWDGLPPAEKIVMAAMAGSDNEKLTVEDVEQILLDSGVQLIVRDVTLAPDKLTEWGLLERDNSHFRFRVPLLREWTRRQRPLRQVKDELDRLDPLADQLFQAGQGFYASRDAEQAQDMLERALRLNPNHLKANLLLARIHIEADRLAKAQEILEHLYQYDPVSARADLLKTLLAQAQQASDETAKLSFYERVLQINPNQAVARRIVHEALRRKLTVEAEQLEQEQEWQQALAIYQEGAKEFPKENKWQEAIQRVKSKLELAQREKLTSEAEKQEQAQEWQKALEIYKQGATEFPEEYKWQEALQRVELELELAQLYREAVGAIELNSKMEAQENLIKILTIRPAYRDVAERLLLVIKGIDVVQLQEDTRLGLLSPFNPLSYLHLLWWIFVKPEIIKKYRDTHGAAALALIGNGLVSSLTWTPLLLSLLALGFRTVPFTSEVWSSTSYFLLAGIVGCLALYSWIRPLPYVGSGEVSVVLLGMLIGGPLGWAVSEVVSLMLGEELIVVFAFVSVSSLFGVIGGMVFGIASGIIVAGLEPRESFSVAVIMMVCLLSFITLDVGVSVVFGIAIGVAIGVVFGAAFAITFDNIVVNIMFISMMISMILLDMVFVVMFVVAIFSAIFVVAGIYSSDINKRQRNFSDIKKRQRNFLTVGSGLSLVVSYLFLIWYLFLGGAALLA